MKPEDMKTKIIDESNNHKSIWDIIENHFMIHPETTKYQYWKIFVMFISIASSILYSFFGAFRADTDFENYEVYYA
jgi:hypothetical protein